MTQQALTYNGRVTIEAGIPLGELKLGDTVLGWPDPDDPAGPRTTHVVIATLGKHYVPMEDSTWPERLLMRLGLERVIVGSRVEGILVDGAGGSPGLFALETNPTLDRIQG
jgi:hypothetical protein